MAKQKKSFFEKITGIKKIEEDDDEQEVQIGNERQEYRDQKDDYKFPQYEEAFEEEETDYDELPSLDRDDGVAPAHPQRFSSSPQGNKELVDSEGQLTIDVYQTDDDVVIKSTIAGVKPEDLDVNINNDMVTIRGERKQDEEVDGENYYYQECYWGQFSRSVILPVEIITEKAEATMKNGILTIRLPKADVTKTRKIQVRGF
jgi:HSP20 family protein